MRSFPDVGAGIDGGFEMFLRTVAALVVALPLVAAGCERADSLPSGRPATAATQVNGDKPPERDTSEPGDSWCSSGDERIGFRLESGETVAVCENAGSSELTYSFGVPGTEPELEYRGPLLASIEGAGGASSLAELATFVAQGGGEGSAEVSSRTAADAARAPDSGGFFHVSTVFASGGGEEAYIFRRAGWEYVVRTGYSRNVNPEIVEELGEYSSWDYITVISPDGDRYEIR